MPHPERPNVDKAVDAEQYLHGIGRRARAASQVLARAATADKNRALCAIAASLLQRSEELLAANAEDLRCAEQHGLEAALVDRLGLNPERIRAMADGLHQIAELPDPVGAIEGLQTRPSGIRVGRMRVPLGVIGIIYESRPNVTADAAALCLKSGNATILRGGSEALRSNQAIATCIRAGLHEAGLPEDAVIVVEISDRSLVSHLVQAPQYIDVVVPRGGQGLIERVSRDARVPLIRHLHGVCHVYVDEHADTDMAVAIAYNAKTQRYGTCNTMESLLVAEAVAAAVLGRLGPMYAEAGVELRGCEASRRLLPDIQPATEADYCTEYLAPILSLRIVRGLEEAMEHVHRYGSSHTEAIVTESYAHAMRFLREVDASSVMVNASTRFADGYEYGLGAEIGISTDKLHARGPVGLEGLTSQKYIVLGEGHVRH